jgi:hypothetical protein
VESAEFEEMKGSSRSGRSYRGSKARMRRIGLRGNSSPGMWIFLGVVAAALFVLMPWLIKHPI